jgi:hypothetical protein
MVLALMFMITVGLTLGGLMTLVGTNLTDTSGLQKQRNLEYGADAAVEGAIQAIRYQAPGSSCPTFPKSPATSIAVDGHGYVVECSMGVPPGFYGRVVEFDACLVANSSTFSSCQTNAIVQADVVYNDVKPGCASGAINGCYGSGPWGAGFWGTSVNVQTWSVRAANNR